MNETAGFIKRQYNNFRIFRAYDLCSVFKELFLFPKDLLSGSGRSSNLLNIALFITMSCNARCSMCNLSDVLNKKEMPDIPIGKIEKILDDVKRYHPSIILFGGEPFIRNDIVDIARAVKKRGLTVGIFTNGLLLNKDKIEKLVAEKLDYIVFSLQGTRDVHDKILGMPGAYDKMISNIKCLTGIKPRKTRAVIHATICEHNIGDMKKIVETGSGLGADLIRFGHPTFFSAEEAGMATNMLKNSFKAEDNIRAISYIYDVGGNGDRYIDEITKIRKGYGDRVAFTPELSDKELRSWYSKDFRSDRKCLFAWRGVFIYPNGDVYPCESIYYKMGNVFDSGFDKVWNGERYKAFRRALKKGLFPACARCCKL